VKTVSEIGLSIRAEMICGGRPLYMKIWLKLIHPVAKRRFSIYFRLYSLVRDLEWHWTAY